MPINNRNSVVLVCVAADVEFSIARKFLSDKGETDWKRNEPEIRGRFVRTSKIKNKFGKYIDVIIAKPHEQGLVPCATVVASSIHIFKPDLVCMIGIAAGRPEKTNIGDILVSSDIWDYNAGKWTEKDNKLIFQPDKKGVLNPDSLIANWTDRIQDEKEYWLKVKDSWNKINKNQYIHEIPDVKFVPTTSGAAVIDAVSFWDRITDQERKAIGLDMEGYALAYATKAMRLANYKPEWIVAKSVCDQGHNKEKTFQEYASYTSTMFLRRMLKSTKLI